MTMRGVNGGPSVYRPELSLLGMAVVTDWSLLEHVLSRLFVRMLGANPMPGAAMYRSLTSTATQKAALRAVAAYLPDYLQDIFEAILSRFSTAAKERNKVVHWVWAWSDSLPDAALLIDPDILIDKDAERVHSHLSKERMKSSWPGDRTYVWKAHDFVETSKHIREVHDLIVTFTEAIDQTEHHAHSREALDRLLNEPQLQEQLDRQRVRRKSGPPDNGQ